MYSVRGSTKVFIPVFLGVLAVLIFFLSRGDRFIPGAQRADRLYPSDEGALSSGSQKGVVLSSRASSSPAGYSIGGDISGENAPRGIYIGEASSPSADRGTGVFSISYTDAGFSLAEITLPVGVRTVRFMNQGKTLFWPAAAGEWSPTLDAGYGLAPGGVYAYQFPERAGNFGVVNRLRSEHRVVIRTQ